MLRASRGWAGLGRYGVTSRLDAPFPWFGGKRKVAEIVWDRFGPVDNYIEPFFGSGAVLLGRPQVQGVETANDKDGFVANVWRSMIHSPAEVAKWVSVEVWTRTSAMCR